MLPSDMASTWAPLHSAAHEGSLSAVRSLLEQPAAHDPCALTAQGDSAIHLAAHAAHVAWAFATVAPK